MSSESASANLVTTSSAPTNSNIGKIIGGVALGIPTLAFIILIIVSIVLYVRKRKGITTPSINKRL